MGELLRDNQLLPESSLNLGNLAREKGISLPELLAETPRWKAMVTREHNRRIKAATSAKEYRFIQAVYAYQNAIPNNSRFRVYAELLHGRRRIYLVTEFKEFSGRTEAWDRIEAVRRKTRATQETLWEDKEIEHSWKVKPDGTKYDEKFGENHGKLARQVEFFWRIECKSIPEVKRLVRRLTAETGQIWKEAGVSV